VNAEYFDAEKEEILSTLAWAEQRVKGAEAEEPAPNAVYWALLRAGERIRYLEHFSFPQRIFLVDPIAIGDD
jgi:hypothetical protein